MSFLNIKGIRELGKDETGLATLGGLVGCVAPVAVSCCENIIPCGGCIMGNLACCAPIAWMIDSVEMAILGGLGAIAGLCGDSLLAILGLGSKQLSSQF
ncbi:MAG: hypothetical protein MOIL_01743 [Candidatus Methanolliviera sp. GoM_oil]|nr:MAG: hypothetical protein MOIL_01743 [Candidatus Methanolliviera sp. GoM_oil]